MDTKTKVPEMISMRQAGRRGPLSEFRLRILQKQGKLPGIFCGRKFLVNYDRLIAMLNAGQL